MSHHTLAGYAVCILRRENEILLIKRSASSKFAPNHYGLIGGRTEQKETFRTALIRELFEETDITVNQDDLHFAHVFYREGTLEEIVVCVFECSVWQGEPVNKEPEKATEVTWFHQDKLPDLMIPAHKNVLSLLKDNIKYSEQAAY